MFLGHYGVALAAKRVAPRTSLGMLFLAGQFLDTLWPVFLLTGLEEVRIVPGLMAASPLDFVHYPYSHSFAMAVVWGLLVGGVWFVATRQRRGALVAGGLVLSHWLLDLPMHRPDLPLWPGSGTQVGGGLWNSVPVTLLLEFLLLIGGVMLYLRATRARGRVGRWGLWALLAVLALGFLGSFGSAPPHERALAWGALVMVLFIPWAWWVDRNRTATSS